MATYKVLTDNCVLGKVGATVTEAELEHLNLAALVEAGHIAPTSAKQAKSSNEAEGE